jgi:hypothetical protein
MTKGFLSCPLFVDANKCNCDRRRTNLDHWNEELMKCDAGTRTVGAALRRAATGTALAPGGKQEAASLGLQRQQALLKTVERPHHPPGEVTGGQATAIPDVERSGREVPNQVGLAAGQEGRPRFEWGRERRRLPAI